MESETRLRILLLGGAADASPGLARVLRQRGHVTLLRTRAPRPGERPGAAPPDLVVTDDGPGAAALEALQAWRPGVAVAILARGPTVASAVAAMRQGAVDYLPADLDEATLAERLEAAVDGGARPDEEPPDIVGSSGAMVELRGLIERVASSDAPVLIRGESGTGKELVARAIHRSSRRRGRPFVAVSCAALAHGILESELFGHVKGAFTGARSARRGLFLAAHRGSVLLDEIGASPASFQVKLLRVLEDGEVRPLGSDRSRRADVRVIAASNVDLRDEVRAGRFRHDLYFRLDVVSIVLPALRERGGDIELLAAHFAARAAAGLGRPTPRLGPELLAALRRHGWPGNVRELRNVMERAVLVAAGARSLGLESLPADLVAEAAAGEASEVPSYRVAKREALERFTREYLERLLALHGGNVSQAARSAGLPRQTVHRLLHALRRERAFPPR